MKRGQKEEEEKKLTSPQGLWPDPLAPGGGKMAGQGGSRGGGRFCLKGAGVGAAVSGGRGERGAVARAVVDVPRNEQGRPAVTRAAVNHLSRWQVTDKWIDSQPPGDWRTGRDSFIIGWT
ncbi:hypothetical protein SKAU_G00394180 [Synaphobranchus kaupii]|uniref:Uncharacterized protein n=1 Tax=Synaphobranchus kaupii TaxID=118154 RepID=A0A9Q1ID29_SYNKA|nr:hypothetical protein SKAU_G00394180 [Synaphobranchus kaupii]